MAFLKRLIVAICLVVAAQNAAPAQNDLRGALIGTWAEYQPGTNLVQFAKDGSWKLYLTKGEIGELHTLDGKWVLTGDDKLAVTVYSPAGSAVLVATLTFEGEEMVLTDEKGVQTRHRRHQGPIPERYRW